jgi:deoxyribonuclease-4
MNRKIGAHVSASGGVDKAIERASAIGANCVQVFSSSPRLWRKPALETFDSEKIETAQEKLSIKPIVTHALYLINLASENPEQIKKSIDSLIFELKFDSVVKGSGVVVHLGSHQGRGWLPVREAVLKGIIEVLQNTPDDSIFMIENSAGQQGKLCSNLEDIQWLINQVKSPRLKWCIDTCHTFCAGYLLSPKSTSLHDGARMSSLLQEIGTPKTVEDEIDRLGLWSALNCIHVNDSRDPFGSGKDRHDNLGDGMIPKEDLHHFLNLKQLKDLPLILEVPGLDGEGPDAVNISRLKEIVGV